MEKTITKIVPLVMAKSAVDRWKHAGEKVVFTNGCFDIIHRGHVDYLETARTLGDRLVVGLNTDRSVRQLKGNDRPIQDEQTRSQIVAAFSFVDLVVFFEDLSPLTLIRVLLPNVLVKGSDYLAEDIIGANIVIESGGVVKTIQFLNGFSTTKIIEKIKQFK